MELFWSKVISCPLSTIMSAFHYIHFSLFPLCTVSVILNINPIITLFFPSINRFKRTEVSKKFLKTRVKHYNLYWRERQQKIMELAKWILRNLSSLFLVCFINISMLCGEKDNKLRNNHSWFSLSELCIPSRYFGKWISEKRKKKEIFNLNTKHFIWINF